jgi:hypothetical protein
MADTLTDGRLAELRAAGDAWIADAAKKGQGGGDGG